MKIFFILFTIFILTLTSFGDDDDDNDGNDNLQFVTGKPKCDSTNTDSGCLYLQGGTIENATTDNTQMSATCTNFKKEKNGSTTTCQIPYNSQFTVQCKKQNLNIQISFNSDESNYKFLSNKKPKKIYWSSKSKSSSSTKQGDSLHLQC